MSLENAEAKFKTDGEPDWETSKFYPAIRFIYVSRNKMKSQISERVHILSDLALFGSTIQEHQDLFSLSNEIDISKQTNMHRLNKNCSMDDILRYICQRTKKMD